jgi:cell division protein FtsN
MGSPGKDLPKISDEFRPASPQPHRPAPPAPPKEARLQPGAARGPQPVTRPAPMAPRTPPRPAPQAGGARPVTPIPQGATGLGDRLRAERQAAEKLAEQRVAQARGKSGDRPLQPPVHQQPIQRPTAQAPEKPKFSFSPEELAKDKREQAPPPEREFPSFSSKSGTTTPPPPLTPPRPALGGNAAAQPQQPPQARQQTQQPPQARQQPPQPPPVRQAPPKPPAASTPAATGFQPRFGGAPQPSGGNYRSLDPPPSGGFAPKPRPYADTAFREDPLANRPASREYDSYRRGPALPPTPQPAFSEDSGPAFGDYRRRQQVPARTRQPAYDEDVNEVFEDEEPPRPQRRRASAQDYNRAYRDYEDGYDAEVPRRRGPWPWLAAIAILGLIAGGIIYYYLTYMKTSGQATGNVPTIEAPDQAPKTAPEPSSSSTPGTQGATQPSGGDRKQIYDRILGDDEVGGNQVVPTQEQPQMVEPTGDSEGQDAAPLSNQPSGAGDNATEPLPLPLPPPGDQQGSLPSNASQQTAGLGAATKDATQPVPEPASTGTAATAAPVPGQLPKTSSELADPPLPQVEQAISTPEPLPEKPVKPKARVEKKPIKKVAATEDVGAGQSDGIEPLVLVPPAQSGNAEAQNAQTQIAQPDVDQQANAEVAAPAEQKSKSFFGLGSTKRKLTGKAAERANVQGAAGNWANSPDPNSVTEEATPAPAPAPEQQVASVAPEPIPAPEPAPQQAKPAASGYVAQLASFRSEAEAMAEFDRLRAKHGNVLTGLSPRVVKATVAGGSRYRLGVGPLASRSAALKICNSLIAAGERDCLVRGN